MRVCVREKMPLPKLLHTNPHAQQHTQRTAVPDVTNPNNNHSVKHCFVTYLEEGLHGAVVVPLPHVHLAAALLHVYYAYVVNVSLM